MLATECQRVNNIQSELRSASAKFLVLHGDGHPENQKSASGAFFMPDSQSESQLRSQTFSGLPDMSYLFDYIPADCTKSYCRFDLTPRAVNYCTPKADNCKNLKHKNIPKHVSNNYLVLTYN